MKSRLQVYQITPNDTLFARDARPMETGIGSGGGRGANWPLPSLLFRSIHAALHRAFEKPESWEHKHRTGKNGQYSDSNKRLQRFGSLVTIGPFPEWEKDGWLFPQPADVLHPRTDTDTKLLEIAVAPCNQKIGDLPNPLQKTVCGLFQPAKKEETYWIQKTQFESLLRGEAIMDGFVPQKSLFKGERTVGIGVDPENRTQDGEMIYSAEYLRLSDQCTIGAAASLPLKQDNYSEGMTRLFSDDHKVVVMGGQQRVCGVKGASAKSIGELLPQSQPLKEKNNVKWVLLSPAVFPANKPHPGGWLPTWIDAETGRVQLKAAPPARGKGESRLQWRERVKSQSTIGATLVAAKIPKPIEISSFGHQTIDSETGEFLPHKKIRKSKTSLAVPAGAVYYFEADDESQARLLSDALSWHGNPEKNPDMDTVKHRRSTLWGEQGYGIGVCGPWNPKD